MKREIVICEALAPLSRRNSRRVVSSNQFGDSRDVAGIWDGRIRIDAEEEEGLRFFPAMLNRRSLRSWDLWINSHDRAGLPKSGVGPGCRLLRGCERLGPFNSYKIATERHLMFKICLITNFESLISFLALNSCKKVYLNIFGVYICMSMSRTAPWAHPCFPQQAVWQVRQ